MRQVLSLFTTIPPLISTSKLIISGRACFHHRLGLYIADAWYLMTGDKSKLLALSGPPPLARPVSTSPQSVAFPDVLLHPPTNNPGESPAEEDRQSRNSMIGSPREDLCPTCNQRRYTIS